MKYKYIITLFLLLTGYQLLAQSNFYYYKDGKIPLQINTQYAYLLCRMNDQASLQQKLGGMASVTRFHQDIYQNRLITTYKNSSERIANAEHYYAEIRFTDSSMTVEKVNRLISQLRAMPEIVNVSHSYNNVDNDRVSITNYLWVGLKHENQMTVLLSEAAKINYAVVGQNPYMPEWVMLCPNENATLTQMQAANSLSETKLFAAAEPELIGVAEHDCTNDPLFNNQWGLLNTGQYGGTAGMDTRVCGAYNTTVGSNAVDIAIIDEGFENTHPDLDANVQNTGYDAMTNSSPTTVYGSHGTSCAGIAAAQGNNVLGVTGVAYGADLMSSAVNFNTFTWANMSDAFNWARGSGGAEILSNSWGWNNPSALFDNAVTNALTLGRGGLGCVVLFSAGNDNLAALIYPKNSNPDLVIVGAMSPCGQRKSPASCDGENWWGSNRGQGLNVMAPGVIISTTDRQGTNGYNGAAGVAGNYTSGFNGTSSACPHAAGVAALILSVNPCLTQNQVEDIMDRTARKVGGYLYFNNPGLNPNGSWHTEMGYGLLDAEAAVKMAGTTYLQNLTEGGTNTHKGHYVEAGFDVVPFITNGNYTTTAAANITINATNSIILEPGCNLQGAVDATILPAGNCSTW